MRPRTGKRSRGKRAHQGELAFTSWGGPRRGAGRKPKGEKPMVSHLRRDPLAARFPVLVTAQLRAGLPSLRQEAERDALERAFELGSDRFGFRLVHYSVQENHLHLIVEAGGREALSRGLQGLFVRTARALNRLWGRRGSVFADRYDERLLRTPREVRNALAYVLLNARRHGDRRSTIDGFSSGRWFDGWKGILRRSPAGEVRPVAAARTWLLRLGWRRHGLIAPTEVPSG